LGSKKGCKGVGKVLALLFSLFCLIASFGIGNMTQVNAISGNIQNVFGIPTWITGAIVMILVGLVVVGGLKRIAAVTEKIVPFMVILYMVGAVAIFFMNISHVGAVFTSIFKSAFGMEAAAGGVVGYGIKLAIEWGMKRGVFSNEAGLGSSVMVHSNSNVREPVKQGMWGIFEVFADTIVVCTLTAFAVLSSGLIDLDTGKLADAFSGLTKNDLVATVFEQKFGVVGSGFIAVSIALFAFSTVLGWSHYGTKACEYLLGEKRTVPYRILFVLLVFGGAVMGDNLAWDLADTFNGLMMIPNLIGVIVLSGVVMKITKNYVDRRIRGNTDLKPMLSAFPDIQEEQEASLKAADAIDPDDD
ncbi:MAG: amino acid carrier protein, partial [Clostridia bacterium]